MAFAAAKRRILAGSSDLSALTLVRQRQDEAARNGCRLSKTTGNPTIACAASSSTILNSIFPSPSCCPKYQNDTSNFIKKHSNPLPGKGTGWHVQKGKVTRSTLWNNSFWIVGWLSPHRLRLEVRQPNKLRRQK